MTLPNQDSNGDTLSSLHAVQSSLRSSRSLLCPSLHAASRRSSYRRSSRGHASHLSALEQVHAPSSLSYTVGPCRHHAAVSIFQRREPASGRQTHLRASRRPCSRPGLLQPLLPSLQRLPRSSLRIYQSLVVLASRQILTRPRPSAPSAPEVWPIRANQPRPDPDLGSRRH
jgi:hypothetical protein